MHMGIGSWSKGENTSSMDSMCRDIAMPKLAWIFKTTEWRAELENPYSSTCMVQINALWLWRCPERILTGTLNTSSKELKRVVNSESGWTKSRCCQARIPTLPCWRICGWETVPLGFLGGGMTRSLNRNTDHLNWRTPYRCWTRRIRWTKTMTTTTPRSGKRTIRKRS